MRGQIMLIVLIWPNLLDKFLCYGNNWLKGKVYDRVWEKTNYLEKEKYIKWDPLSNFVLEK